MAKRALWLLAGILACSCGYFKEEEQPKAVARVNNSYLQQEDIKGLVPPGTPKEDSIAIVKNYIDHWALQKLLYDAAVVNLDKEQQQEFDALVKQYTVDLYTKAYLEAIVKRSVDTVVTQQDLEAYYKENKDNFKTTETLVKLRYIRLPKDFAKFSTVNKRFLSGSKKDRQALNDMALQFKSYAFNDTTWVDMDQVYGKLPFIKPDNRDKYIADNLSYQYTDSTDVYLVKVNKVLPDNRVTPFEYIKPTLEQLIINNRKLELIKKFQKDITDDAIKNSKYEIYK
ncbi:peptidylprolyl isomerase [Flavobacterium rhizosphaerae]|uniref:Peptidyl-prolyl cis-trans isomerase n=1 Tax=Flavobacterium rhizosphaerae TaxID=3163298 RepID=A0ABW8Z070_9FLAO